MSHIPRTDFRPSGRAWLLPFAAILLMVVVSRSIEAQPRTPVPSPTPAAAPKATRGGDMSSLALDLAESLYRIKPSPKSTEAFVQALELFLVERCIPTDTFRTLQPPPPPADPKCMARLRELNEINPGNPIGTCLQAGLGSPACRDAYLAQTTQVYDGSQDTQAELLDPALKSGISARGQSDLSTFRQELERLSEEYSSASSNEEMTRTRRKIYAVYDKMMAITCSVIVTKLVPAAVPTAVAEDPRIKEVREKLSKIPAHLRADYQKQMVEKYEEELSRSEGNADGKKVIVDIIRAIQQPAVEVEVKNIAFQRFRFLLQDCENLLSHVASIEAQLPHPTCYRTGWLSPQCFDALTVYNRLKKSLAEAARPPSKTDGAKDGSASPIGEF
jgi:flagellar basal body-associated protein FliL